MEENVSADFYGLMLYHNELNRWKACSSQRFYNAQNPQKSSPYAYLLSQSMMRQVHTIFEDLCWEIVLTLKNGHRQIATMTRNP